MAENVQQIHYHEASKPHKTCYLKWKNLKFSLIEAKGVDSGQQKQIQLEVDRNKAILERIFDVTLSLASRNLAFRWSTDNLDDVRNGNFLELLAQYDPLLKRIIYEKWGRKSQAQKWPITLAQNLKMSSLNSVEREFWKKYWRKGSMQFIIHWYVMQLLMSPIRNRM